MASLLKSNAVFHKRYIHVQNAYTKIMYMYNSSMLPLLPHTFNKIPVFKINKVVIILL